ncbi:sensor histidine kinase [Lactococcus garvieae]|uniref:histidine kinase n=1 Tax=Lactococcus garvieae DCC43 TaxID=1231377 RepID=K2PWA9_9LACT|nr:HAMP domain-containing sensor histidine kinase [Lactococcus garvieae]EKF51696.1 sensor histidine kinase [Lactococcus garvieae DCC43]
MKKIIEKIKSMPIVKNDGKNFLHFFLDFTIIFFALTVIILQVLTSGVYKSTDQNLRDLASNPDILRALALNQSGVNQGSLEIDQGNYNPTNSIVMYDENGTVLNPTGGIGTTKATNGSHQQVFTVDLVRYQLERTAKLDKDALGQIKSISIRNPYGADWHYRYVTLAMPPSNTLDASPGANSMAYIQVFSNVDQLQDSLSRSNFIIITTMVMFWFISVIISLYLANWTLRPVMEAYEKQKAFVENASHELRTPLAILQNRLELLFQKPNATIIDESENISESLSEVRNMRLLTSNLLNMARQDNNIKINPEATDKEFFEAIFSNYHLLAESSEKSLKTSLKFDGSMSLDQSLVKQLLTILFDNAMKYTGEDGEIQVDVQRNGLTLMLSVADNGEGISDEDKKKIFDRFYRVDKARTRQKGGLGLGLSLAQQIAEAHNGRIIVEDNSPRGTKFVVRLRTNISPKSAKVNKK